MLRAKRERQLSAEEGEQPSKRDGSWGVGGVRPRDRVDGGAGRERPMAWVTLGPLAGR